MLDLAIVGGGPGGLMSAWYLKKKLGELCRVTIYEASDRVGGKILTRKFDSAPAMYEAGVAEIYDYSMTGPDPLRELIQHFGLQTIPMDAEQVQFDGELLNDVPDMRRKYGARTADAIEAFRKRCAEIMSPVEYYEGVGAHDNEHPWAYISCEQLLDKEVDDPIAKRFFKVMARSDLATESHNTNGLNALKNFVMDVEGYIGLYSIQNGNEQLIDCLQSEVNADIHLNHRVLKVGKTAAGRYRLNMMNGRGPETKDFDLVLMCLPHSWLATMGWDGEQLRKSMVKHIAYFDRPAHYLRVSILFDEPFWGEKIPGAWFMSEAFGGCCVYNEGARHDVGKHGVLNWLIAGSDALAFANLSDQELIVAALKSQPRPGRQAAVGQDRPRLFPELSRGRPVQRGLEQVHRSRLSHGRHQDRLGQGEGLQALGRGVRQRGTGGSVACARHRCLGHREQPRGPCQDAERAAEVQHVRLDRRYAVQRRRIRFRIRDQPVPCRGKTGSSRGSGVEPRGEDGVRVRIGDVGHGAGFDRSLRPVARGQEARHLA